MQLKTSPRQCSNKNAFVKLSPAIQRGAIEFHMWNKTTALKVGGETGGYRGAH